MSIFEIPELREALKWAAIEKAKCNIITCEKFHLAHSNPNPVDRFWFGHYYREYSRLINRWSR